MRQRLSVVAAQFNWRMLLVRWLVHALVLLFVALLVPKIYFTDRRVWVWLVVAAGFGILNSVLRPLIQALMLQLFFASLGLVVALINGFMLYLVSWIFPNRFAVDSIFWALAGGLLVVLLGTFLEGLFGLTRPIVPESETELRHRLKAQDRSLVYAVLRPHPVALASEDAVTPVASLPSGAAPQDEGPPVPAEVAQPAAGPDEVEPPVAAPKEAGPGLTKRARRLTARRKATAPETAEQSAEGPVEPAEPQPPAAAPEEAIEAEPAAVSDSIGAAEDSSNRGEEAGT
jgi:putative membrane protein